MFDLLAMSRRWRLVLLGVVITVLLYGLFRPQSPPDLFENSDKWLHLLAFTGLAFCTRLAYPAQPALAVWPLLFACAPGLEYLQHVLQPVRTFSGYDAWANTSGVLCGLLGWGLFKWGRLQRLVV